MPNTFYLLCFRIPEIYETLIEIAEVQIDIADRERTNFTDSLEKSRDVMIVILPSLMSSMIKRECDGCFTSHPINSSFVYSPYLWVILERAGYLRPSGS